MPESQASGQHKSPPAVTNWLSDLIARALVIATSWLTISAAGIALMVFGHTKSYNSPGLPDGPATADGFLTAGVLLLVGAGIIRAIRKE
jgi:hypothetical protein